MSTFIIAAVSIALHALLAYWILRTIWRNKRIVGVILILGLAGFTELVIKAHHAGAFS